MDTFAELGITFAPGVELPAEYLARFPARVAAEEAELDRSSRASQRELLGPAYAAMHFTERDLHRALYDAVKFASVFSRPDLACVRWTDVGMEQIEQMWARLGHEIAHYRREDAAELTEMVAGHVHLVNMDPTERSNLRRALFDATYARMDPIERNLHRALYSAFKQASVYRTSGRTPIGSQHIAQMMGKLAVALLESAQN